MDSFNRFKHLNAVAYTAHSIAALKISDATQRQRFFVTAEKI